MRLRVEHLSLVGTAREVDFQPGLNVILGPITTGKSSLIKLLRVLLGSGIPSLPPEVREHVSALAGQLVIGDERASVVRPLTTTPTAPVDVATESGVALRLPALQARSGAPTTYGRWLLEGLGLPDLSVAAAPTRPAESAATAVSINDYLGYCRLTQEEIDTSVFGSEHPQRNIKRQYVFRILYGLFDARLAALQEELRQVEAELRLVRAGAESFTRFLQDTPWQNRAVLAQERDAAEAKRRELDAEDAVATVEVRRLPRAQELRGRLQQLDQALADTRARRDNEQRNTQQLEELAAQLETQSNRLTKSIVAGSRLYDLDFRVCPRCASPVQPGREDPGRCYLCLQEPQASLTREDLVGEQERLSAQVEETATLITTRQTTVAEMERRLVSLDEERARVSRELDEQTGAFVSDQAEAIARRAAERAGTDATIKRCEDYLQLFARLDAARAQEGSLEERKERLEGRDRAGGGGGGGLGQAYRTVGGALRGAGRRLRHASFRGRAAGRHRPQDLPTHSQRAHFRAVVQWRLEGAGESGLRARPPPHGAGSGVAAAGSADDRRHNQERRPRRV
jgi:hypothetical protein